MVKERKGGQSMLRWQDGEQQGAEITKTSNYTSHCP